MSTTFAIRDGQQTRRLALSGRVEWTMRRLIEAGPDGITASELPAGIRLSHFIWLLKRRHGVPIASEQEPHGGEFSGFHSRYKLACSVHILDQETA